MRARMAILKSGTLVELREILLRDKPRQLLNISPKATVPVLLLANGDVIDESWQIMLWALMQDDPDTWLNDTKKYDIKALVEENDNMFKAKLDLYKYAVRHPQHPVEIYRSEGEIFLKKLEQRLQRHRFFCGDIISIADIALMPFVRQFAHVDKVWFNQSNYPLLQQWLTFFLNSALFTGIMHKYSPWKLGDKQVLFSASLIAQTIK